MRRIYENAAFLVRGGIFSQRFLSHTTYKDFEVRSAQLFFFSPYCENSVSVKHTHPLNESVLRGHLFNQVKHPPKTRILTNQVQMPGRGILPLFSLHRDVILFASWGFSMNSE